MPNSVLKSLHAGGGFLGFSPTELLPSSPAVQSNNSGFCFRHISSDTRLAGYHCVKKSSGAGGGFHRLFTSQSTSASSRRPGTTSPMRPPPADAQQQLLQRDEVLGRGRRGEQPRRHRRTPPGFHQLKYVHLLQTSRSNCSVDSNAYHGISVSNVLRQFGSLIGPWICHADAIASLA